MMLNNIRISRWKMRWRLLALGFCLFGGTLTRAAEDLYGDPLPAGAISRMGTVRFHAGSQVRGVAWSPDGKLIASLNFRSGRQVVLWDASTGREQSVLKDSASGSGTAIAFSPQADKLAVGSSNGRIAIWKVSSNLEWKEFTEDNGVVVSLSFSSDGSRLAAVWSGRLFRTGNSEGAFGRTQASVTVWDVTKNAAILSAKCASPTEVALSPDGKTVAIASEDKTARVLDAETGKELFKFEEKESVCSLAFSRDGHTLAYGTWGAISARDAQTGRELWRKPGKDFRLIYLTFSPDSETVALVGHFPPARIWNARTGEEIHKLVGHTDRIYGAAFAPDGKRVATGSDDGSVRLWDTATGKQVIFGEGHEAPITHIAISPDGKSLVSGGGSEQSLRLWEVPSGRQLRIFKGHENHVEGVAFSPDGKLIASGCPDRTIRLWDPETGRQVRQLECISSHLGNLTFSGDGRLLAMAGAYQVDLWDVGSGKLLRTFEGHESYVFAMSLSPDGKTMVSGGQDNTIRIWDVPSGRELHKIAGDFVSQLEFSPDGKWFAASAGGVHVYETATGNELFKSELGGAGVAITPDGKKVVTTSGVMDAATGKVLVSFGDRLRDCGKPTLSRDGKFLATVSGETVLVWDWAELEASAER